MSSFDGSTLYSALLDARRNRLAIMESKLTSVRQILFNLVGVRCYWNAYAFDGTIRRSQIIQISKLMAAELASFYSSVLSQTPVDSTKTKVFAN